MHRPDESEPRRGALPAAHRFQNVESNVGRQRDGIAALADQNAPLAIERHPRSRPSIIAPRRSRRSNARSGNVRAFSPATSVPGIMVTTRESHQRDDQHHGDDLDQREAGLAIDGAIGLGCRPAHAPAP